MQTDRDNNNEKKMLLTIENRNVYKYHDPLSNFNYWRVVIDQTIVKKLYSVSFLSFQIERFIIVSIIEIR